MLAWSHIYTYNESVYCMHVFFQMQHGVTTEVELLRSHSLLCSLHTERLVRSECRVVRCKM